MRCGRRAVIEGWKALGEEDEEDVDEGVVEGGGDADVEVEGSMI